MIFRIRNESRPKQFRSIGSTSAAVQKRKTSSLNLEENPDTKKSPLRTFLFIVVPVQYSIAARKQKQQTLTAFTANSENPGKQQRARTKPRTWVVDEKRSVKCIVIISTPGDLFLERKVASRFRVSRRPWWWRRRPETGYESIVIVDVNASFFPPYWLVHISELYCS